MKPVHSQHFDGAFLGKSHQSYSESNCNCRKRRQYWQSQIFPKSAGTWWGRQSRRGSSAKDPKAWVSRIPAPVTASPSSWPVFQQAQSFFGSISGTPRLCPSACALPPDPWWPCPWSHSTWLRTVFLISAQVSTVVWSSLWPPRKKQSFPSLCLLWICVGSTARICKALHDLYNPHLRAFTLAVTSAWNTFLLDGSLFLSPLGSLLRCHLLSEAFSYPPV